MRIFVGTYFVMSLIVGRAVAEELPVPVESGLTETFREFQKLLPAGWSLGIEGPKFLFLGPNGDTERTKDQRARITLWFSKGFVDSTTRRKKWPNVNSWGITRVGQVLFTRNDAAEALWPQFLNDIYWRLPVDHVVFAGIVDLQRRIDESDTIRGLMWKAGTRINVQIDDDGHRVNLRGRRPDVPELCDYGLTRRTKFLVVGELPPVDPSLNAQEQPVAIRHQDKLEWLTGLARANDVQILSLDEYIHYLTELEKHRRLDNALLQPGGRRGS